MTFPRTRSTCGPAGIGAPPCARPRGAVTPPRVPGAAQHEVVRCRPGTVTNSEFGTIPDQRCTVSRLRAHAAPHPGHPIATPPRYRRRAADHEIVVQRGGYQKLSLTSYLEQETAALRRLSRVAILN